MNQERRDLVTSAFDICRSAIADRLAVKKLPTSITIDRPIVTDDPTGNGYTVGYEQVSVSSLKDPAIELAMRHAEGPFVSWGLRDQVTELADYLSCTTDLGYRVFPSSTQATGPKAIVDRFISPLVMHYLRELADIRQANPSLADRLAEGLTGLRSRPCGHSGAACRSRHKPDRPLAHRNVELRRLSGVQRGVVAASSFVHTDRVLLTGTDFVVPERIAHFMPSSALEITTDRPWDWQSRSSLQHYPIE